MTRSTNMEHVEVLERLRERAAEWGHETENLSALDAAIAALSAQPPAEAQPVAWRATVKGLRKFVTDATFRRFSPEIQRFYEPYKCGCCRAASPSVPVGVEGMVEAFEEYHRAGHRDPAVAPEWEWWQAAWNAALAAQQGVES